MVRMRTECCFVILYSLVIVGFFCIHVSHAADTLAAGQVMRDWEYLESSNKLFKLLFFSGQVSRGHYLGIEHVNATDLFNLNPQMKLVWVANRGNPLPDTSGLLNITDDGNLVLTNRNGTFMTLNSEQLAMSSNTNLTLLDTGNLVLRTTEQIVWQSFDFPSDTWLPGMKLGWFNLNTGPPHHSFLTSFVAPTIPTRGAFTLGVDPNNREQLGIWQRGVLIWRSGTWNGHNFGYFPDISDYGIHSNFSFRYFSDANQSYFTYTKTTYNIYTWIEMGFSGQIIVYESLEGGGVMKSSIYPCADPEGEHASKGCLTRTPSNCRSGNSFNKTTGSMDGWTLTDNSSLGISDCKEICMRDCSCTAFTSFSSDGSGCKISYGKMFGFQEETIYIRNHSFAEKDHPRSSTEHPTNNTNNPRNSTPPASRKKSWLWLSIALPVIFVSILVAVTFLCCMRWRNRNSAARKAEVARGIGPLVNQLHGYGLGNTETLVLNGEKEHELPFLDFSTIEAVTGNFSYSNKIGQGGFGPVYKGKLINGQEIAVKRLSRSSGQGLEEFKTEVLLISKLQHRNLVRLLGYSIQGEERILIYEYLPNKSLDTFLFDAEKRVLLDWKLLFCIIEGIAQGLLYLHKYSRLRIIHRDLKTSNILLDNNMNPKISDFGTARVFGENESRANTQRIIGTYGYMSPEYAMDGLFSVKSDVYSFGVMMLEILSGKRNSMDFYLSGRSLNLVGYAWELWNEGQDFEVIDPLLAETCSRNDVKRCVNIALLCVQESAADRPTMSGVLSMLGSEMSALTTPKKPAFSETVSDHNVTSPGNPEPSSINMVTISQMEAR